MEAENIIKCVKETYSNGKHKAKVVFVQRLSCVLIVFLSSCHSITQQGNLRGILNDTQFLKKEIQTSSFLLTSYERINANGDTANIYIEGDGRAWLNKRTFSLDPTPENPVALKLARIDSADKVIYLARPCQYRKMVDGSECEAKYWTSHRFSPKVVDTMNEALSVMKRRHNIKGFHLIGFSGGGNIAALLTARRSDVLSLRTIAGNLDHELQSKIHNVSPMPYSLSASKIARQISDVPQLHFIGKNDEIVPKEIYEAYKGVSISSKNSTCINSHIVEDVGHAENWEMMWGALLSQPVECGVSY